MSARTVPKFSLIVATYGRAEVLSPLIASLVAQTHRSFEVIVADQNADDRVAPFIEPLRTSGQIGAHIRLPEPNLSAARNAGLAAARGQYVVFPDDDCWYDPETLAEAAAFLEASPELDGLAARWAESPISHPGRSVLTRSASSAAATSPRSPSSSSVTPCSRSAVSTSASGSGAGMAPARKRISYSP
jgi:glycosyltransferase involved in cell wall biosynthesis